MNCSGTQECSFPTTALRCCSIDTIKRIWMLTYCTADIWDAGLQWKYFIGLFQKKYTPPWRMAKKFWPPPSCLDFLSYQPPFLREFPVCHLLGGGGIFSGITHSVDCSQSPIFPWDCRCRSLCSTGPSSWSLDASETGERTKCPWVGVVELLAWGERAEKIGRL